MTEDESEVVRGLHRELGLCERQRDDYRALLEKVVEAYDGAGGTALHRAMEDVRAILEMTA